MEFCIRWISLSKKGELFPPTWKKWFDLFRNQFDLYLIEVLPWFECFKRKVSLHPKLNQVLGKLLEFNSFS